MGTLISSEWKCTITLLEICSDLLPSIKCWLTSGEETFLKGEGGERERGGEGGQGERYFQDSKKFLTLQITSIHKYEVKNQITVLMGHSALHINGPLDI